MNITPQVETAEISDADLDFVSGGNAANLSGDVTVQTSVGDSGRREADSSVTCGFGIHREERTSESGDTRSHSRFLTHRDPTLCDSLPSHCPAL